MKKVSFVEEPQICITYSIDEYPREIIDSVIYRRAYRRISDEEMYEIYISLDIYKLYEMIVHIESLNNNQYYTINKLKLYKTDLNI